MPWGGGGRRAALRVTVLAGISSMEGGRSVQGGGGACVMLAGRVICKQCFTWGLVLFPEKTF